MMFKEFDDRNWYDSEATRAKTITSTSTSDSRKYKIMRFTGKKTFGVLVFMKMTSSSKAALTFLSYGIMNGVAGS